MEKWIYRKDNADVLKLSKELKYPPFFTKILTNRNLKSCEEILSFVKDRDEKLPNPSLLPDAELFFEILSDALESEANVRIVGDYDADGVMSTLILVLALRKLGLNPTYCIPNRFTDGYGMSMDIVRRAAEDGVDLIITCDNGISCFEEVAEANSLGISVIITDHHDIPRDLQTDREIIPAADAIVDPKLGSSKYPFKELCGAGVCYQLMAFVLEQMGFYDKSYEEFLQYAAVATICDIMPLVSDNRKIVHQGLRYLNNTKNVGFIALRRALKIEDRDISAEDIGYIIGPAINAAGRMASAETALKLFLGEGSADELAQKLVEYNRERKAETEKGVRRAIKLVEEELIDDPVLICYVPEAHEGVSGNIAGRLKEKYQRPVLLLSDSRDFLKASGRSVPSFHITEALSPYRELFITFGGHGGACGFSIERKNLPTLRERLFENIKPEDIDTSKVYYVDCKMPLEALDMSVIKFLSHLSPFGSENPEPIFTDLKVKVAKISVIGKNKNVIRFTFLTEHNRELQGLLFSGADDFIESLREKLGEDYLNSLICGRGDPLSVDILYKPMLNEYQGKRTIQVKIEAIRFSK